jgi:predicted TIM-barrel fold metal-dependent hydrolase
MDITNLVAIDVHTHAEVSQRIPDDPLWKVVQEAAADYFKAEGPRPTIAEIAAYYRERKMACVIFPVDMESTTGLIRVPNEEVAEGAAANPDVLIIMAHPSFPWQDEALSVCTHKPQVYIDLSGWSPKYFPLQLIQYANTLLKHKVLFGSDYPLITPDRWLADFEQIDIRPEVRPLILKENAVKLLGLDTSSSLPEGLS